MGRPLAANEIYEAFGYRKSAYYKAVHEGRLVTANNLLQVAKYFGLNPVDLLVRFGLVEHWEVVEYVEQKRALSSRSGLHRDDTKPPV